MRDAIVKEFKNKKTYSKEEAIVAMVVLGYTMRTKSIDDIYYYYLDGKFYKSNEYNPFDINSVDETNWIEG